MKKCETFDDMLAIPSVHVCALSSTLSWAPNDPLKLLVIVYSQKQINLSAPNMGDPDAN